MPMTKEEIEESYKKFQIVMHELNDVMVTPLEMVTIISLLCGRFLRIAEEDGRGSFGRKLLCEAFYMTLSGETKDMEDDLDAFSKRKVKEGYIK